MGGRRLEEEREEYDALKVKVRWVKMKKRERRRTRRRTRKGRKTYREEEETDAHDGN